VELVWTRAALKGLMRVEPSLRRQTVIDTMERVAADPFAKDNNVKPLTGLPNGYRRRFGDLRVSYTVGRKTDVLEVFEVSPRGGAYR
jgi:mRNA-degrading endonuclease RelE of RelBE toxin-antitoxin system